MKWIKQFVLPVAVLFALGSFAVPIKPDLQKILKQQEKQTRPFEPAHAGWNGPELQKPQVASPNPVYEAYGPASTARAIRAALAAAATPDPIAILAIGLLILMLRYTRHQRANRERAVVVPIRTASVDDRKVA
jgi:hypothetical protein